jgi:hypothetical protein
MKTFAIKSILLAAVLAAWGALFYSTLLRAFYRPVLPFLLLFFWFVTNLVHWYSMKIAEKPATKFTARFMAASFVKLFFYLAVAVVYVFFKRENAGIFLVNFLVLYLVFTVFEVTALRKVVKDVN